MCTHAHIYVGFFFSSRRRHTRFKCDWSSDVWLFRSNPPRPIRHHSELPKGGLDHVSSGDRKSVVEGKSVDLGGRRIIKKKYTVVGRGEGRGRRDKRRGGGHAGCGDM